MADNIDLLAALQTTKMNIMVQGILNKFCLLRAALAPSYNLCNLMCTGVYSTPGLCP